MFFYHSIKPKQGFQDSQVEVQNVTENKKKLN